MSGPAHKGGRHQDNETPAGARGSRLPRDHHVRLPNWIHELGLAPMTKDVLLQLAQHANWATGECNPAPSVETMAARIGPSGVSPRTVQRHLRLLETTGLIDSEGIGGRGNTRVYRVLFIGAAAAKGRHTPCHPLTEKGRHRACKGRQQRPANHDRGVTRTIEENLEQKARARAPHEASHNDTRSVSEVLASLDGSMLGRSLASLGQAIAAREERPGANSSSTEHGQAVADEAKQGELALDQQPASKINTPIPTPAPCAPAPAPAEPAHAKRRGRKTERVLHLDDASVAAIQADHGRSIWWDDEIEGFGLRVSESGHRSFVLQYRMRGAGRGANATKLTIGSHGRLATDQARRIARAANELVRAGIDPSKDRDALVEALSPALAQPDGDRAADRPMVPDTLFDRPLAEVLDKLFGRPKRPDA